jgi:hypothetical protein
MPMPLQPATPNAASSAALASAVRGLNHFWEAADWLILFSLDGEARRSRPH